jgi:membrane protease YdiL (CAAX protease family)
MPAALPRLRTLFVGPSGFRAGWRLLAYVALVTLLFRLEDIGRRILLHESEEVTAYVATKAAKLVASLLASSIMARLERRPFGSFGLPWRQTLRTDFWRGAFVGFTAITGLLVALRAVGAFHFGRIMLGTETWGYAVAFALIFLLIAVQEEFHYRGYGVYTLTTGLGFWPAALLSALYFGWSHLDNHGETALGVLNVCAGGMLFCLLLRRTGSLWMPIGLHTAWDWGQSFFYGVPDSGYLLPNHLFDSSFTGSAWVTGGTVGPEGSLFCTVLFIVLWFVFSKWLPQVRYPALAP